MTMETVVHGHPSWADLSTSDVEAAATFYADLFGWTVVRNATDMGEYYIGSRGEREVAGMMAQAPEMAGAPSLWACFFFVEDIDATIGRVSGAGGNVLQQPFEIPGGARVGVVADPGGAMFALISDALQPGPYFSMTVGAVSWFELMTSNTAAAERFYAEVFGWTAAIDDTGDTVYTVFSSEGAQVAGMIATPTHLEGEVPDNWSLYFTVDDCAAAEQRAVELGGRVVVSSKPTPMGPFAVLADPQGAMFQVMEFTSAA